MKAFGVISLHLFVIRQLYLENSDASELAQNKVKMRLSAGLKIKLFFSYNFLFLLKNASSEFAVQHLHQWIVSTS